MPLFSASYWIEDRPSPEFCMQMTAKPDSDRFQSGADKYAAYLETPAGRCAAAWLSPICRIFWSCRRAGGRCAVWNLGCGTAATAVRLARLGIHMTLLDSSSAMLDIAKRAAREAGVDGEDRSKPRRRGPSGEPVSGGIVRRRSLPQHPGVCRPIRLLCCAVPLARCETPRRYCRLSCATRQARC